MRTPTRIDTHQDHARTGFPRCHRWCEPAVNRPISVPWNAPSWFHNPIGGEMQPVMRFAQSAGSQPVHRPPPGHLLSRTTMSLAIVHSRALLRAAGPEVTVEVLANGLPSFTLVGLADTEVKEARGGCARRCSTVGWTSRTTGASPSISRRPICPRADASTRRSRWASRRHGHIDAADLDGLEFAGELSLAGDLRPVRGALPMALALQRSGRSRTLVLPRRSAEEAALVPGLALLR